LESALSYRAAQFDGIALPRVAMPELQTAESTFKGEHMLSQISWQKNALHFAVVLFTITFFVSVPAFAQTYVQTNLVSDIPGLAPTTDHLTVNPWGITRSGTSPWWIADNGTGVSTIYNGSGVAIQNPPGVQFVVTIPTPGGGGTSAPTGTVFNGTSDFAGAAFVFATEDGTISTWSPANQFTAVLRVNHSSTAIYKGLTKASFNGANYLYAADFHTGKVEVFDKDFNPFSFSATAFTDSSIPAGFAPFNVQAVGSAIVVTFAMQDKDMRDEVARNGLGFVDVFTTNGQVIMQLQSGPWLNAPWGAALAPPDFGELSNRLLIGNFGSGLIAAFDAANGSFVSFLKQSPGAPLKINGLWGIGFGNGGAAGPTNTLFFAAGDANEHHGIFGKITQK
jgi:uncharacterized protein (TIGR03118 family)